LSLQHSVEDLSFLFILPELSSLPLAAIRFVVLFSYVCVLLHLYHLSLPSLGPNADCVRSEFLPSFFSSSSSLSLSLSLNVSPFLACSSTA